MTDMEQEPTDRAMIESVVRDIYKMPELGIVDEVYEHQEVDDKKDFQCDVEMRDTGKIRNDVLVEQPTRGSMFIPEEDELVKVIFLAGNEDRPLITGRVPNHIDRPPMGEAGMARISRGVSQKQIDEDNPKVTYVDWEGNENSVNPKSPYGLFFDIAPDGSYMRLGRRVKDDEETQDVHHSQIRADAEIVLKRNGNIRIAAAEDPESGGSESIIELAGDVQNTQKADGPHGTEDFGDDS